MSAKMITTKILSETDISFAEMQTFIRDVDSCFKPPLSQRIDPCEYANKLWSEAVNIVALGGDDLQLLGLCSFYCTPELYEFAYLSLIVVHPSARKMAIGRSLLKHCQKHLREVGMPALHTRTWVNNTPMSRLLESCSFEFMSETIDWDNRNSFNYRWFAR